MMALGTRIDHNECASRMGCSEEVELQGLTVPEQRRFSKGSVSNRDR